MKNPETDATTGFHNSTDIYQICNISQTDCALSVETPHPTQETVCLGNDQDQDQEEYVVGVNNIHDQEEYICLDDKTDSLVRQTLQFPDEGRLPAAAPPPSKLKPKIKKTWECPGSSEQKEEFLKHKGDLLAAAGRCIPEEGRAMALNWANKHVDDANLQFAEWLKSQNPNSNIEPNQYVEIPDFWKFDKSHHDELINTLFAKGKYAFLALEWWHGFWLYHAASHIRAIPEIDLDTYQKIRAISID